MSGFQEANSSDSRVWGSDGSPVPLTLENPDEPSPQQPSGSAELTSEESALVPFAPERMIRQPQRDLPSGWRRTVRRLSLGVVCLGLSEAERRQRDLVVRVRTPIRGSDAELLDL